MIPQNYIDMLGAKSVIRTLSEWATARGQEIGYDNVFDYSLGNPSVPCPEHFTRTMIRLLQTEQPVTLHGYSPSLTSGAAGALAHALRCVCQPGQEVLVPAPFFPEYKPYIEGAGLVMRTIPPRVEDFQIDLEAMDAAINENTAAVLINTPNNPSGAVYTADTMRALADLLTAASARIGRHIFLISDEPYREILFGGQPIVYPAKFYADTLTCYSFSKSLSLPGERIGYVAANPACEQADLIVPVCGQISRGTGHNCPASIIQLAVAECIDETSDLTVYERNMELIYAELKKLGFDVVKPDGTFYIFPRSLEPDAVAFCQKATRYDLVLVPGDSFGCPGHFRMAYCIDTEKVQRSFAALHRFVREEYGA